MQINRSTCQEDFDLRVNRRLSQNIIITGEECNAPLIKNFVISGLCSPLNHKVGDAKLLLLRRKIREKQWRQTFNYVIISYKMIEL